jgi:hypothetical protein
MLSATYSPEDNKLRLYASMRLSRELYDRVKAAGFKWAPKQDRATSYGSFGKRSGAREFAQQGLVCSFPLPT